MNFQSIINASALIEQIGDLHEQKSHLIGKKMIGILGWIFGRRKKAKLLNSLQEKAQQKPQNCQAQIRLGNLLIKMGKKKAALEAYHQAAENFAQQGFNAEATAMCKIVMRLDPLQGEMQSRVSRLFAQWETLQEKKSALENRPETNHGTG